VQNEFFSHIQFYFMYFIHFSFIPILPLENIFYFLLGNFPGVARVFIYPNLVVIRVPSLAEIAHLDVIFSIITSTLVGGTSPTYCYIFALTIQ
jgi:hypothetical protein